VKQRLSSQSKYNFDKDKEGKEGYEYLTCQIMVCDDGKFSMGEG